jgi:hypothetical protein
MAAKLPFANAALKQRDIPLFPIPECEGVDVPGEEILNGCVVGLLGGILDDHFVAGGVALRRAVTSPVIAIRPVARS